MTNVINGNFGSPPPPFPGLTDAEADTWRDTMACWPSDHFKASDYPLLAEYCRALATATDLSVVQLPRTQTIPELKAILDLRDREVRRAAALSRTLRLAPQSRYDRQAMATAARSAGAKRPWDTEAQATDA